MQDADALGAKRSVKLGVTCRPVKESPKKTPPYNNELIDKISFILYSLINTGLHRTAKTSFCLALSPQTVLCSNYLRVLLTIDLGNGRANSLL